MKAYLALTKPRITWLILMSTAIGYFFGAAGWNGWAFAWTLAGTGLLASGTATLNQWWERDADARMRRTERRPLPAGQVTPAGALAWGVVLSAGGFAALAVAVNFTAAWLGLFTLLSYLFAYTPLKRITPHATTVGAIPGAMPPLIGYAGAHGGLTVEAWTLGAILFIWQFPHFYSIAWLYRDDYARAGIRMKPAVDPSPESTAWWIVLTSALLIPVSLAPALLSMTGRLYLIGAAALGLVFLYSGIRARREQTLARARQVLVASVLYLPLLYALMMLDRPGL
jgi:protoheme IX farnesyltransferase